MEIVELKILKIKLFLKRLKNKIADWSFWRCHWKHRSPITDLSMMSSM